MTSALPSQNNIDSGGGNDKWLNTTPSHFTPNHLPNHLQSRAEAATLAVEAQHILSAEESLIDSSHLESKDAQTLVSTRAGFSRVSLDRKLIRVQRDVLKMGALVENSCLLAREALCQRDLEAAQKIPIQDKQIDKLYRQIEVDCTNLLNLEAPVTQDLRLVSAFMQMVRDLERIGDYTKSISNSAIKLFPYPEHACMDEIATMTDRCRSMVALCLRSLTELDSEAGRIIKQKDNVVDDDYKRLYAQLVSTPCTDGAVEPIVLLVLVIRALERIADHATNVGKRVTYVVTGERS